MACQRFALKRLELLDASETKVSDDDLATVRSLPGLTELDLNDCEIDDRGLATITELPVLQILELDHTRITERGAEVIGRMKGLRRLDLFGTPIGKSPGAIKRLRELLPAVEINADLQMKISGKATTRGK